MKKSEKETPIVIVGCGFAGTSVMLHTLLRIASDDHLDGKVHIKLVERREEHKHAGLAYGRGPEYKNHNLNIGAKRVNPFPANAQPAGFPTFVQYIQQLATKDESMLQHLTNPSRQLYGDYLQHLIGKAIDKAGKRVRVSYVMERAVKVEDTPEGPKVKLESGDTLAARHVVLATGFQDALVPKFAGSVAKSAHFVENPYCQKANSFFAAACSNKDSDVLIIGTGLTAMDVAARLINSGHAGKITMISRRTLMHKPYEETSTAEYIDSRLKGEPRPENQLPFTAERPKFLAAQDIPSFMRSVVREYRQLTAQGYTSEEIISYWERFAPEVSRQLPKQQLAELVAKHDALITTSRVGVTPEIGRTVRQAITSGRIEVISGSIDSITEKDGKMNCTYTPHAHVNKLLSRLAAAFHLHVTPAKRTVESDFVFSGMGNSTSYDHRKTAVNDPLWRDLLESGQAMPHWTKSGVTVDRAFSLVGSDGAASKNISVIGVPIAGHMMVTEYAYPERSGSGGRLGPAAMNVVGITGATLALLDQKYEQFTAANRKASYAVSTPRAPNFKLQA